MSLSSKSSSNSHHLQIKQQNKVSPARSLTYCCLTSLLMISQVDVAGVARGVCHNCTECPQFVSVPGHVLCAYCGCPPAKHLKTSLVRVRKRGRESESKELTDTDSDLTNDSDSEETSSGVSSSGSGAGSGRRQRRRQKWRPSVQVSAPPPRVARLVSGDHADTETWHLGEDDMRTPDLAEVNARPAPLGPHGPSDSSLIVPPTPKETEDTEAGAEVRARSSPTGPTDSNLNVPNVPRDPRGAHGPTDPHLNVPNDPTQPRGAHSPNSDLNVPITPQHTDSVVTEPVQLLVNVLQDGNGLLRQSGYRAAETDDMDFITRLVRQNIVYNRDYYKQCFESKN